MKIQLALFAAYPAMVLASLEEPVVEVIDQQRSLIFSLFGNWRYNQRFANLRNPNAGGGNDNSCSSSDDCDSGKYCAKGQCLNMGSCETNWDCRNPENLYPIIECTGPIECNAEKQCGRICGPSCRDGTFGFNCPTPACSIAESLCSSNFTSCQNDNCGGCNALVFDDLGNHELCVDPSSPPSCESSSDCNLTYPA